MILGIIITHADFASGLKNAVEMISGKQEKLVAIKLLEGEGLPDVVTRIKTVKKELEVDEAVLFVDMFGATPFNSASVVCAESDDPVVAGVNLPLLLTFVLNREHMTKEELLVSLETTHQEDFKIIRKTDLI
ncbi:mannose/fructose/sorbose-specific phosphotransferase system IIA component [Breznakia sp. PF5-3]|uniref:PTS sugar transporter subunit IIA n=1 Tax=unclassified Breznakia TaxID=2623764 RepID=UPI0024063CA7|nr:MULTISPECIES: PTS fructose transporter subunit IIA [unclassified Breznakia]MDF9825873.1 mannose/fructose/sorbose-specific phosphotransferase system IIA component [Breznakia sp. PM6-1]MDF9836673.1 mannose/fructose/sorbose-specific phosphotransferase system IIA component [Breznakia sp. PF5-3]MDF9838947.1 mannose/fructose/sorbose-specific phosphotransferase system IIA component [Breznakia sp. PFB2-8]MDF9860973.1 mannose/fructose/sorbose-specific phosphotransferase system IIA component [Breznaki